MASGRIRQDLDASAVRLLILGALNWAPEWYSLQGDLSPDGVGELMAAMIIDGLTAPGAAQPAHRTGHKQRG